MAEETQVVEQAQPSAAERVMQLEGESRDKWLETGKLPEVTPKTESDSSTDDAPTKEAATPTESKQEQEQQSRKPSRRDQRILELLNENKRLASELEKGRGGKPEERAADKPAAKEQKTEKVEASPKPVLKDFQTYEDWVEAITDWKADQRVTAKFEEDRTARETAAKTSEIKAANKEIEHVWMERVNESKKVHDDYEQIAFNKDLPIKSGSVVDRWILESEFGPEVLYHLGSHPDELSRINGLSNIAQARELTKIESSLEKTPAKPASKVTKAPKPPAEVNGNGTISNDPVEDALKAGNFRKYMEEQNARDLKSKRG